MTCYKPVSVGVLRKPLRPGGRRFRSEQTVPCGHCLGCRADQAREWSIRMMHETQMHESAWFVTLTYDDANLPKCGSLRPEDLRNFFKSVRKVFGKGISYFACGEYGEATLRPHYHLVLYGLDLLDKRLLRDSASGPIWRSSTLESHWTSGLSEFGTVTRASAAYVAGYVRKKIRKKDNPEAYERLDSVTGEVFEVEKEFARMSLRPAIGKRWIEKYWQDVYPWDRVVVEGKEYRPPRYYDRWMDENQPEVMFDVRLKRDEECELLEGDKLAAKEKIHKARVNLFESRGRFE